MSRPAVGKLITGPPKERDAIHVPIIEAVSGGYLDPGDPVTLTKENGKIIANFASDYHVPPVIPTGVIDPFIKGQLVPGDRFYCWLFPNSTKKLWHDWTHKDID